MHHALQPLNQLSCRGHRQLHGINTPLFSLLSHQSSGIGEFLDLKPLIDWLKPLGFNVIQLLPLYDTGNDPSPYNPISANALNPIYISLQALPGIDSLQPLKKYNRTKRVHYKEVKELKLQFLQHYVKKNSKSFSGDPTYELFLHHHPWLAEFNESYRMIQFIAYKQMEGVKLYAEQQGMLLMGDIPILVSSDSIDVQTQPHLFNTHYSAGAPPDFYSADGQNWGFPIYNFEALEKENFHFWRQRLASASQLYHLYRLDHIVGFFRIWAIPKGKSAIEGHYIPKDPADWVPQGERTLKAIVESSSMLPIGEDLGIIPKETRKTMHTLGIPGTKVVFWERKWKDDESFIPFADYPEDSLTTISTHDSEPFSLWWQVYPEDAKTFAAFMGWDYTEILEKKHLFDLLKASHRTPSRLHINLLQEYLNLIPELTDGNLKAERINVPKTVSSKNWSYRYKYPIEKMAACTELSDLLKQLLN